MKFIQRITEILLLRKTSGKLLGMELNITDDAFYLSSESYIENKVTELNPGILSDKGKFIATPLPHKEDIEPEEKYDERLLTEYQQVVGSLIHASNSLRFDVTYSVGVLSRMVTKVDKKLLTYAYRVLDYLYTTKNYRLIFKRNINRDKKRESTLKCESATERTLQYDINRDDIGNRHTIDIIHQIDKELTEMVEELKEEKYEPQEKESYKPQLQAYVDADFAGDRETRRSTTGFIICVANTPVYWRSKLQSTVATRTAEAEIIALYELSQELLYYTHVMNNLGIHQKTIEVYEDNQAAIAIMTRPEKQTKMRHLDTKYFKIQELISEKTINVNYVKSANNVSDLMTKALPTATHKGLLKHLGLWHHQVKA
jgi:hypothetical protein